MVVSFICSKPMQLMSKPVASRFFRADAGDSAPA
jgi:hypothetical protein